jgi:DNA repair exonuclease SbcCD ATPase subunit
MFNTLTEATEAFSAEIEKSKALSADLEKAKADLVAAQELATEAESKVSAITGERDELQAKFSDLEKVSADQVEQIASINGELTKAKEQVAHVEKLESLCAVNGIDPKAAVPNQPKASSAPEKTCTRPEFDKMSQDERAAFVNAGGRIVTE